MLRLRNGLGAFGWTDISIFPGSTPVKRQHLLDLRTALMALDAVYTTKTGNHISFAETVTADVTPIRASHLSELRIFVQGLE